MVTNDWYIMHEYGNTHPDVGISLALSSEARHEKTSLHHFRSGPTQTGLYTLTEES